MEFNGKSSLFHWQMTAESFCVVNKTNWKNFASPLPKYSTIFVVVG